VESNGFYFFVLDDEQLCASSPIFSSYNVAFKMHLEKMLPKNSVAIFGTSGQIFLK
jgi:hypothetical protein